MLDKLAEDIGSGVIVVPLPPSVILAFGCRPGTAIRMLVKNGQIRVMSNDPIVIGTSMPTTVANIAEACRQWWKSQ
jgi:hypothetical protein